MSPDAKSALVRAARTAVQVAVAWFVTALVAKIPALDGMQESLALVLWVGFSALFAWAWRRFVDPSSVPSLIDPDTVAAHNGSSG